MIYLGKEVTLFEDSYELKMKSSEILQDLVVKTYHIRDILSKEKLLEGIAENYQPLFAKLYQIEISTNEAQALIEYAFEIYPHQTPDETENARQDILDY